MIETFLLSFRIQIAHRINSLLFRFQQVLAPFHRLHFTVYGSRGLKILAAVLAAIGQLLGMFLGKFVYVGFILACSMWSAGVVGEDPASRFFPTFYLLFTLAGICVDTWMFSFTRQDYYAVILMRMNARERVLGGFAYAAFKSVVGLTVTLLVLQGFIGVPWWMLPLLVLAPAGGKSLMIAVTLGRYGRSGRFAANKPFGIPMWPFATVLLVLGFVLRLVGWPIPDIMAGAVMGALIVAGAITVPRLLRFDRYPEICKIGITEAVSALDKVSNGGAKRETVGKAIAVDTARDRTVSTKHGLAYLNELFISRHRKILWKPVWIFTGVCAAVVAGGAVAFFVLRDQAPDPTVFLPWMLFILYFVNRGREFTEALYINCDHGMLTYPFYKRPGRILQLFRMRLWEITKINLMPSGVLGLGMAVLMAVYNPGRNPLDYGLVFVSIVMMGVFFSVHYLALYYVLQPYTLEAEVKSIPYQIAIGLTYGACWMFARNYGNPSLPLFSALVVGFCAAYSVLACVLVYTVAPRTFRIKA